MNINNLPLNPWELDYIWSEDKVSFVLKVDEKDLQDFIEDDTSELYIRITEDNFLQFKIALLNVQRGTHITMDIQESYTNDKEVVSNLRKLLEQDSVDFFVSDNITTYHKILKIFDNDKLYIKKWLGDNVVINQPSLEDEFKNVPIDYIIPQKTDTSFWFLCKVNNEAFNSIKNQIDNIRFGASIFEGYLVLFLYTHKPLASLASIFFSKKKDDYSVLVNDDVRDDFKLFFKFNTITFLINNEEGKKENIINVPLKIDEKHKELIKEYMNI